MFMLVVPLHYGSIPGSKGPNKFMVHGDPFFFFFFLMELECIA